MEEFNKAFENYKGRLLQSLDEKTVNYMMYAFCMGYLQLSGELNEEFDSHVNIDPVLDKINELVNKIDL